MRISTSFIAFSAALFLIQVPAQGSTDKEKRAAERAARTSPDDPELALRCAAIIVRAGAVRDTVFDVNSPVSNPRYVPPSGKYRTTTGAIFTRVGEEELRTLGIDPQVMGESWRDETGMIWGDEVKDGVGNPHLMDYRRALTYARQVGLELPSREDFVRLRNYLGATTAAEDLYATGYTPQVLPNLFEPEGSVRDVHADDYWSSTPNAPPGHLVITRANFESSEHCFETFPDTDFAYLFDGKSGEIYDFGELSETNRVRLVVRPKAASAEKTPTE